MLILTGILEVWIGIFTAAMAILTYELGRWVNFIEGNKDAVETDIKNNRTDDNDKFCSLLEKDIDDKEDFHDVALMMSVVSAILMLFLAEFIAVISASLDIPIDGLIFIAGIGALAAALYEVFISAILALRKIWILRHITIECSRKHRKYTLNELLSKYYGLKLARIVYLK